MIRSLPVDSSRISFIATGHVTPVIDWVPDPSNPGRNMPGEQKRFLNEADPHDPRNGQLVWNVDAMADGDEFDRAEVIGVQLTSNVQPVVEKFRPVPFQNLSVSFSANKATGQLRNFWNASGIGLARGGSFSAPSTTPPVDKTKPAAA